jgi:hypothetical protein
MQFFCGGFCCNYTAKEQHGTKASATYSRRNGKPFTIARGSTHGSSLVVGTDF